MSLVIGQTHGVAIAEALGIPAKSLRAFTLRVRPNELVTVVAVYAVVDEDGRLVDRIRRLHLQTVEVPG